MDPTNIPSGVEPIPQSLLDKLLKAAQAPPHVPKERKPIPPPPSNPYVKPEARLPPIDSVAISRADGMIAIPK
jgi:hypothetical protein